MPSQHIWKDKDEQGQKREVRATRFGGAWRFQAKSSADSEWTYYDAPPLEDLLTLKAILDRKYRRRRASFDDVVSVEKMIKEQIGDGGS